MNKPESLHFAVNGVEQRFPETVHREESSFGELMKHIRSKYGSRDICISSIRVDGRELTENEEVAFDLLPLTEIQSLEIFTAHPREIAEETLQNLILFTDHLAALSRSSGQAFLANGHPSRDLAKLMDGIEIFLEALSNVRQILRVGASPALDLLEADLSSLMKDLLESYQKGEIAYVAEILRDHLPTNLDDWRNDGLPGLIRARDS